MKYFIFVPNKDSRKLTDYAKDLYYTFIEKYNYSENEIKWYLARNGIEFQGVENILFDFQDYILDHMYEYGNYSYEDGDYELIEESKKSARKSIKEERYNVELSDYSGSIVDEDTFDKKSDAIQWANDNGRNCYARIWDNEEGKTVKEWKVKSIKESADDNWYKLKMLNEMLDAMEEDEYNIPKLGIYGVTKNIDLDKGAIEALIKYYK